MGLNDNPEGCALIQRAKDRLGLALRSSNPPPIRILTRTLMHSLFLSVLYFFPCSSLPSLTQHTRARARTHPGAASV